MSFAATILPFTSPQASGASEDARLLDAQQEKITVEYRILRAPSKAPVARELARLAVLYEMQATDLGHACYGQAMRFLIVLPSWLTPPELGLDPDGEVAFDWAHGDDMVSVSVGADGRLAYVWAIGDDEGSNGGGMALGLPVDLLAALKKIG